MAPNFARNVSKEMADKFDDVVSEGTAHHVPPSPPARAPSPPARAKDQAGGSSGPSSAAVSALREALEDLRDDIRQGIAAAAQTQFDALVPLRAMVEQLAEDLAAVRDRGSGGTADSASVDALRDEVRHLASKFAAGSALTVPPDLVSLRSQLDQLRQEMLRDRGHRDALRASVLDAVGSVRNDTANVRDLLDRANQEAEGRNAAAKATAAGLIAVRDALAELKVGDDWNRSAVGGVDLEVIRAIETVRRDLGEQLRERATREADIDTLVSGIEASIKAVNQSIADARSEDERGRQAAMETQAELLRRLQTGIDFSLTAVRQSVADGQPEDEPVGGRAPIAQHELVRTLEAFHDELVEQWRERKLFEASVPPQLEGLRHALTDGLAKLSASIEVLPAALAPANERAALAPGDETAGSANEAVLREVAAVRAELADRAGQLDEFLRTSVVGANRWFIKMRDDLYERIDEFGEASTNGQTAGSGDVPDGHTGGRRASDGAVVAAIDELRADVKELYAYLSILDTNLQRFHDTVVESTVPKPAKQPAKRAAARPPSAGR